MVTLGQGIRQSMRLLEGETFLCLMAKLPLFWQEKAWTHRHRLSTGGSANLPSEEGRATAVGFLVSRLSFAFEFQPQEARSETLDEVEEAFFLGTLARAGSSINDTGTSTDSGHPSPWVGLEYTTSIPRLV